MGIPRNNKRSKYATFTTVSGGAVAIRISDHNATVSNFDQHGEKSGLSIVVSRGANNGILNDGDAHLVEFFYSDKELNKSDDKPLVQIIRSIQQSLFSGVYEDTTGLAEIERESVRFYKNLSNGYVVVVEKEYKNSPDDMETITMWAEMSPKATNARQTAAPDTHVRNAILSTDIAKIRKDAENAIRNDVNLRFQQQSSIDAAYFDAINAGDMELAKKLVREYAESRGYYLFGDFRDVRWKLVEDQLAALAKAEKFISESLKGRRRNKSFRLNLPNLTLKKIRASVGRDFDSHNLDGNSFAHSKRLTWCQWRKNRCK